MRNRLCKTNQEVDQEEQIKRNGPSGTDQEEWIKMDRSIGMG